MGFTNLDHPDVIRSRMFVVRKQMQRLKLSTPKRIEVVASTRSTLWPHHGEATALESMDLLWRCERPELCYGNQDKGLAKATRPSEGVKVELEEARAARDSALTDVKSIEARLDYMTSEDGKKGVINGYRRGPVGKAEVSLAVKAGFDFLRTRLPPSVSESVAVPYPSRVRSCVELLEDLEARGGGVSLSSDDEEEDDEEGSDEDDEDDEEDDPK